MIHGHFTSDPNWTYVKGGARPEISFGLVWEGSVTEEQLLDFISYTLPSDKIIGLTGATGRVLRYSDKIFTIRVRPLPPKSSGDVYVILPADALGQGSGSPQLVSPTVSYDTNLAIEGSSNIKKRGEVQGDRKYTSGGITFIWTDDSQVNQEERTITAFLLLSEYHLPAGTNDLGFYIQVQKRRGEDPKYVWELDSDWELRTGNDGIAWYIVAKKDQDSDPLTETEVYRLILVSSAFGQDRPTENFISQSFELVGKERAVDATLYMTGATNNSLYTLNPYTGIATEVGNLTYPEYITELLPNEEVSNLPQDLQFIEDTSGGEPGIYVIGAAPPGLFSVNFLRASSNRGYGTQIKDFPENFGLEGNPSIRAYAASTNQIWLSFGKTLCEVDSESWVAVEIESLATDNNRDIEGLAYGSFNRVDRERLYMISGSKLYTINLITGSLGFQEWEIGTSGFKSIVFVGNELYGLKPEAIYKIDINLAGSTGSTTRQGGLDYFGLETSIPIGITSDGVNLYMIDQANHAFYQIEIDSSSGNLGLATKIIDLDLTRTGESSLGNIFYFRNRLYMYSGRLFNLNFIDGTFFQVRANGFGHPFLVLTGLTEHNGQLYGVGISKNEAGFFRLDKQTGRATEIGASKNFGPVNQTHPSGLAYKSGDDPIWYMVGTNHNNRSQNASLYTLNPRNGIATKVGSEDIINFGVNEYAPTGLAYHPDIKKLYMIGARTKSLYELNIDETSDEYGTAQKVQNGVYAFRASEFLPQGLTYLKKRRRLIIGPPEEFSGSVAPDRIFGSLEPVIRKFPFYLDLTFDEDLGDSDDHIATSALESQVSFSSNPSHHASGFSAKIDNVGTALSYYQYRLKVINESLEEGIGTLWIQIGSITFGNRNGSPQISKKVPYNLNIPTYSHWRNLLDIVQTSSVISMTVKLKHSKVAPRPSDFYVDGTVNGKEYRSSTQILSVSGLESLILKVHLPENSSGVLQVVAKEDTTFNEEGVLGPVFESRSPQFTFDTIQAI